jgi:exodeoxyribonuclease-3
MRLISWNVNGIRAVAKKGFVDFVHSSAPDVLCLQETKAKPEQVPREVSSIDGYEATFIDASDKPGYSGLGLLSRIHPDDIAIGLGEERFDREGRVLRARFGDITLFNVYFPNGKASPERLAYKMDFYARFLEMVQERDRRGENIVIGGDINTAHREIDLARPKENAKVSGFLPEERAWIDDLLAAGFLDTFREFDPSPEQYTFWDMKTAARERNVGWRIDCFYVNRRLRPRLKNAFILPEVLGSDHCPIGLELV